MDGSRHPPSPLGCGSHRLQLGEGREADPLPEAARLEADPDPDPHRPPGPRSVSGGWDMRLPGAGAGLLLLVLIFPMVPLRRGGPRPLEGSREGSRDLLSTAAASGIQHGKGRDGIQAVSGGTRHPGGVHRARTRCSSLHEAPHGRREDAVSGSISWLSPGSRSGLLPTTPVPSILHVLATGSLVWSS